MSFFKKLPSQINQASSFFKKTIAPAASNFFKKGGQAESFLDRASSGLGRIGNALGNISNQTSRVLDSPVAASIAHLAGPQGSVALQGLKGGNQAIGLGGNLARQGSQISNRGNYSGSPSDVATNILERSKQIYHTGAQGHQIQFA